jgi:bifunctional non-homologous end joining protein LigD
MLEIPAGAQTLDLRIGERTVRLTHLDKTFFPHLGLRKGDLVRYYLAIADPLVPHLRDRALVMKRYPDGVEGESFYMKRTPSHAPPWVRRCSIAHRSGNVIDFPIVDDAASLAWVVNLGCIDLHPWYSRCDDVDRPDVLNLDLDPVKLGSTPFRAVLEAALAARELLSELGMPSYAKTSGSRGVHLFIPIVRGPLQKDVWCVAKALARLLEQRHPSLITAEYRIARRPAGRVLVDYNQNAWGKTLASAYSVRPTPAATVSTPVTWEEIASGIRIEQFGMDEARRRVASLGDIWAPLLANDGRFDLSRLGPEFRAR